ncbi:MAG: sensor histidine kinase KdpD, partial [Magnetococcales bacterium]|nr:sensor histidine kinase KdpD [Magnetococcales bacterium]
MNTRPASPGEERILVCVSPSPSSARLIHAAANLAEKLGAKWLAVAVEAPDAYPMDGEDRRRLLSHLRLAESLGAQPLRLTGLHVNQEILRCARQHGITRLLVGKPTLRRWRDLIFPPLVFELLRQSGTMEVLFMAGPELPPPAIPPQPLRGDIPWNGYAASLLLVALTTLAAFLGRHLLTPADTVMLYLLPIMASKLWQPRHSLESRLF